MKRVLYGLSPDILHALYRRIEASPVGYRLAKGAFWTLGGQFAARGLTLVSLAVTARILGRSQFGELGMIQSTFGMFTSVAGFGMGMTATKYVAELRKTDPQRAGRILGLSSLTAWSTGGVMTLALLLFAPLLAARTMAAPELATPLRLGAILLLLGAVNGAQNGALCGFEAFKGAARAGVISSIVCFPVSVCGAYFFGLNGAVAALVATQTVLCVLTFLEVRTHAQRAGFQPSFSGVLGELHLLWNFSLPTMLANLAQSPVNWICSAILANQPGGYAALGQYNAALRVQGLPSAVVGSFLTPILPLLAEKRAVNDSLACKRIYSQAIFLVSLVAVPWAILMMASPVLTYLPFGVQFSAGGNALVRWLMLQTIASAIAGPLTYIFAVNGRMWLALVLSTFQSLFQVGLSAVLVPTHHGAGLAAALTGAFGAQTIVSFIIAWRQAPETLAVRTQAFIVLMTLPIVSASVLLERMLPPISCMIAGVVLAFAFILILLWGHSGLTLLRKS